MKAFGGNFSYDEMPIDEVELLLLLDSKIEEVERICREMK
jgi:hypothetical protein